MDGYTVYTTWYLDQLGDAHKEYNYTHLTADELRDRIIADGGNHVTVWKGDWFGLAPDNQPQPDIDYNIPDDHR